jgi:hypothetical protein
MLKLSNVTKELNLVDVRGKDNMLRLGFCIASLEEIHKEWFNARHEDAPSGERLPPSAGKAEAKN